MRQDRDSDPAGKPGKIVAVGVNYADHAAETGWAVTATPKIFLKAPSAAIGDRQAIVLPGESNRVEHEAELALVIGRPLRRVSARQAWEGIAGYCCANDIAAARQNGYAAYVGEGTNRWPAVHTLDAAGLYRLALEKAPAGSRLHAVADEGVPFEQIATAVGRNLGIPVQSISPDEASDYFGFLGSLAQMDNPASSAFTRELLGWTPAHLGLIADLDEGHYFSA